MACESQPILDRLESMLHILEDKIDGMATKEDYYSLKDTIIETKALASEANSTRGKEYWALTGIISILTFLFGKLF